MAQLVKETKISREDGYLYFIDNDGHISRTKETDLPGKKLKIQVVQKVGIKKEPGYAYFVDWKGNVRRANLEKIEVQEKKIMAKTTSKSLKKKTKN